MKRRLLIIAIFLLLGFMSSVLVAWSCSQSALGSPIEQPMRDSDRAVWRAQRQIGWPIEPYNRGKFQAFGYTYEVVSGMSRFSTEASENTDGDARQSVGVDPADSWLKGIFKEWRAGWPLPCAQRHAWLTMGRNVPPDHAFSPGYVETGLVMLPTNGWLGRLPQQRLPIEPMWTGFAVNTLFYAAILWLLIAGPFALRRLLRLRRGLCPKCAYPMGDSSVCTECGRLLPKSVVT